MLVVFLSLGYFSTRLSFSFFACRRGVVCPGSSSPGTHGQFSVQDQARHLLFEEILNPALQATPETSTTDVPTDEPVTTEKAVAVALSRSIIQTYGPITSGAKVAFLFLTRGHMPMERLWMRFFQGHEGMYSIYVHASDPAYKFRREEMASELFVGRGLPSKPVRPAFPSPPSPFRLHPMTHQAVLQCRWAGASSASWMQSGDCWYGPC